MSLPPLRDAASASNWNKVDICAFLCGGFEELAHFIYEQDKPAFAARMSVRDIDESLDESIVTPALTARALDQSALFQSFTNNLCRILTAAHNGHVSHPFERGRQCIQGYLGCIFTNGIGGLALSASSPLNSALSATTRLDLPLP